MNKQDFEDSILFASCSKNSNDEEEAICDFQLIKNMLAYQKMHNLQPSKTGAGRRPKAHVYLHEQFGRMIEKRNDKEQFIKDNF